MDANDLQRDAVNDRLAQHGKDPVSSDELKLISALLKDSLLSELENLKGRDLTFDSQAESMPVGEDSISGDQRECVICGSSVGDFGHYTVEFGAQIRKRAHTCGLDCMTQFVDALRETKGL